MLSLPCHRQKGGCELFLLSKPGHTSDEEEESCQSTQKHKGLWSRAPLSCGGRPVPDQQACPVSFCALLPTFLHLYGEFLSHPVSVTPTDSQMGRQRRRGCCVAVFIYIWGKRQRIQTDTVLGRIICYYLKIQRP